MSQDPARGRPADASAAVRCVLAVAAAQAGECSAGLVRRLDDLDVLDRVLHATSGGVHLAWVVVDQAEELRRRLDDHCWQAWVTLRSVHAAGSLLSEPDTAPRTPQRGNASGREELARTILSALDAAVVLTQALTTARESLAPVGGGMASDPALLVDASPAVARCAALTMTAAAAGSDVCTYLARATAIPTTVAWPRLSEGSP